jgi:hypothetical protein
MFANAKANFCHDLLLAISNANITKKKICLGSNLAFFVLNNQELFFVSLSSQLYLEVKGCE